MSTKLQTLGPSEAWDEALMRSLAIGAVGFLLGGIIGTVGEVPGIPRATFIPASVTIGAFLAALAFFVAHYHWNRKIAAIAAITALVAPCVVNFLWVRFTSWSLLYPTVALVILGPSSLLAGHRKASRSQWDDELSDEDEALRNLMESYESDFSVWHTIIFLWSFLGVGILLYFVIR